MIEIQGITKTYPDGTVALRGIDLAFGSGLLGLLGPNGAGKSTLLSILTLAQEPSQGTRRYFDLDDRVAHRAKIRQMIGYLPQELEPLPMLSGFDFLTFCAEIREVPLGRRALKRRIEKLLDAVELSHAGRRRAESYSGGMKRRLGLAQALIHSPKFLVVDEPTAGLDPEERIRFRNLVSDLADEIPVLLSTHIVEDIEATCPRLAIIDRGTLLFDGPPGELLRRADGRLWRLPADRETPPGTLKIGRRAGEGGEDFQLLYAEDPEVALPPDAVPERPNLEEAAGAFLQTAQIPEVVTQEEVPREEDEAAASLSGAAP